MKIVLKIYFAKSVYYMTGHNPTPFIISNNRIDLIMIMWLLAS